MTTREAVEEQVARRLWARATEQVAPATDSTLVIDQLLTSIEAGLRRWVGAEGYAALLSRAVALTLPAHAALSAVADLAVPEKPSLDGDAPRFEDDAIREAVIALLAAMMRQLGGIIGAPMAIRLIEISGTPTPRGIAGPDDSDTPS